MAILEPLKGIIIGDIGTSLRYVYNMPTGKINLKIRGTYFSKLSWNSSEEFKLLSRKPIYSFAEDFITLKLNDSHFVS